jgi:hypothetical protein
MLVLLDSLTLFRIKGLRRPAIDICSEIVNPDTWISYVYTTTARRIA